MQNTGSGRAGLVVIGIYKLIKALLLVVAGIGVFKLVHHDVVDLLFQWAGAAHVDPDNKYFQKVLTTLWSVDDRKLREVGAGSFFYAGIFLTEGLGLVLRKPWGEYFTIIVTASFIPVEVYLIAEHLTAIKVAAMLVNIGILWYLVVDRMREGKRRTTHGHKTA